MGTWVRSILGAVLLVIAVALLAGGHIFGIVPLAAVAWFAFEIVRRVGLLRILGARGVLAEALLVWEAAPEGESDWWSGCYEFHFGGRRYEHRLSSFMVSPKSSHGTVVGILFDPVDPNRAVVRGRFDHAGGSLIR